MEKSNISNIAEARANITLENRKRLFLTGVEEVMNFDDKVIALNTKLGFLTIKGYDLKMNKLDLQNGDVIIVGNVSSMVYSSKEVKKQSENLISKLFK